MDRDTRQHDEGLPINVEWLVQRHGIDGGEAQQVRQAQVAGEPPEPHGAAPALGELRQLGDDGQERPVAAAEDMLLLCGDALLHVGGDRAAVPLVRYRMDLIAQLLFHPAVAVRIC